MNAPFINPTLEASGLPQIDEVNFERVAASYLRMVWLVNVLAVVGLLGLVSLVGFLDVGLDGWVFTVVRLMVVVAGVLVGVLQQVEVDQMSYGLRDHDVSFRRGVFTQVVKTVPFSRVQSVTINRNLLHRIFGLAELTVQTAGSNLIVVGLLDSDAAAIKSFVVERAYVAAEEERQGL